MTYTYRFANILSDSDIAELELSNVRFDRRIIQPGSFSADMSVTNSQIAEEVKKVIPGKTLVHVYRDSDIWGTYIIWQVRVKSGRSSDVTVSFSGATMESWFYKRIVDFDLEFSNVDQIDIFADLVNGAQVGWSPYIDSANMNIIVPVGSTGVLRDRTYKLSDAASVGQRIEELANVDDGFEYMIKTYIDPYENERVRIMDWGYPNINGTVKAVQFAYPGNITSYELSYDATEAGTAFWARGDSIQDDVTAESESLITPTPELSTQYLVGAWPHLDKVVDYQSVTNIDTLYEYARWWKDNHSGLVLIPQVEINSSEGLIFSPNEIGSWAQFTITDAYFPLNSDGSSGFSGEFRVVGMEVTPPERGSGETIRFVIETDFDPTEIQTLGV